MSGIITCHVLYRNGYLSKGRRMWRKPINRRHPHSETKTGFMELTEPFIHCMLRSMERFIEGRGAGWLWQLNFVRWRNFEVAVTFLENLCRSELGCARSLLFHGHLLWRIRSVIVWTVAERCVVIDVYIRSVKKEQECTHFLPPFYVLWMTQSKQYIRHTVSVLLITL